MEWSLSEDGLRCCHGVRIHHQQYCLTTYLLHTRFKAASYVVGLFAFASIPLCWYMYNVHTYSRKRFVEYRGGRQVAWKAVVKEIVLRKKKELRNWKVCMLL